MRKNDELFRNKEEEGAIFSWAPILRVHKKLNFVTTSYPQVIFKIVCFRADKRFETLRAALFNKNIKIPHPKTCQHSALLVGI